jgi:hypothetical protein
LFNEDVRPVTGNTRFAVGAAWIRLGNSANKKADADASAHTKIL